MNKSELIDAIAGKTGLPKTETDQTLNAFLETVVDTVAQGDSVTLVGFGTFKPAHREARAGRNPATGASITIAATTVAKFAPGTVFKTKVAEAAQAGKKKKK